MQSLDAQSVATILPAAAATFGVAPVDLNLVIAGYFAGAAAFLPMSGWCADRFGVQRVFRWAICGFVLGSLVSCLAPNAALLVTGRVIQGVSASGLMPIGRLLLVRTSEPGELVQRLTWLTVPPLIGPLVGPALAGVLATYFTWRAMFLISLPVGAVGYVLIRRYIPNLRDPTRPPLDVPGALLAGTGLSAAVAGLGHLASAGPTVAGMGLLALTLTCAAGYAWHARRAERPILDFRLCRIPSFNASVIGGIPFRLSAAADPFLYALLFQVGLGMSAALSGTLVTAASIGALAMKTTVPSLIRRFGFRRLLLVNGFLCAVLAALPAAFTQQTPLALIVTVLLARGFFRSLQLTSLNALTYADPPPGQVSAAASLAATVQQLAQALSIAAAAALIGAIAAMAPQAPSRLSVAVAILVLTAVSLLSLPVLARLPADAGVAISGARRE
jgi:MFS family permease